MIWVAWKFDYLRTFKLPIEIIAQIPLSYLKNNKLLVSFQTIRLIKGLMRIKKIELVEKQVI